VPELKILITGGAGVLGSTLCKLFLHMGHNVTVIDYCRKEEAWRLFENAELITYIWKSEQDITRTDLLTYDLVFDCAIGFADRPFGSESPQNTALSNIIPSLTLLEKVRRLENRPLIIYPSSFNALYGLGSDVIINEDSLPLPTSIYGWTKASVELLFRTYFFAYNVPVVITRTSSTFGPTGRSDELPHKLMLSILNHQESFPLRSPHAERLWTFAEDVSSFYEAFVTKFEQDKNLFPGRILHLGGNKDDKITSNIELASMISKLADSDIKIIKNEYESGELVNGKPISFNSTASETRELLNWRPKWVLEDSLEKTFKWFKTNSHRYMSFSDH
jgi:nucleoside-diphosphate-sugar epimerase